MDNPHSYKQAQMAAAGAHQQVAGLLTLLEVTKELAAEKDLERLLELIIRRACTALHSERASLFLYDQQRQELYTRKVTQLEEGTEEIRLPLTKGIAGLAARTRNVVHVPDPYRHPDFDPTFDQQTGFRTRNILAAPLLAWGQQDKLLGVLQLLNRTATTFNELDQQLLGAFAAHAAIAIERAMLARQSEEMMQLRVSLDLARRIQAGLLPRQLPEVAGYQMAALTRPAEETGGDYYDVIPLSAGRIGLVVADVSGHGFGPSLLMATLRAALRGIAGRLAGPAEVLNELSRVMLADLQHVRRFITLLFGALDPQRHEFHYANAGHGPVAVHLHAADKTTSSLVFDDARGYPLGWFEQTFQPCRPVQLAPGDVLVLGTDGVVETRREGQQFGIQRLCDFLLERLDQPLGQSVESLVEETIAYNDSGFPDDDLTLLVIRRL